MEALAGSRHLEIVLLHEINAGTFARLYLAEARAPGGIDRIVAVKILREQWNESEDIVARTRDEARLLARLRHKNILKVEDLAEIDGQPAIIMEFVDGVDLKQLVEGMKRARIPARTTLQIAQAAASALEAAHFRIPYGLDRPLRVVHRDIKPSNIMVSVEGEVKVLDFGTARSSQALRSAQTGALRFGSLKYMSPERREGDRGEHPADVYALALVTLELLRGEWLPLLPMDIGEHDDAVAQLISRLDNLGMPNREWDTTLRQVLTQMLSGDPAARPTAEQVVKLMRAFAEQASGVGLDTFAADCVGPITRELRGGMTGGAMAGTRFVVNVLPEPGQGAAPRSIDAPRSVDASRSVDAPRPASPPRPMEAQHSMEAPRAQAALRPMESPHAMPPPRPVEAPRPVEVARAPAADPTDPWASMEPRRNAPRSSPTYVAEEGMAPREIRHSRDSGSADGIRGEAGSGRGIAMAVGAGVFVLLGLGFLFLAGAAGFWFYGRSSVDPAVATLPEAPVTKTPPPTTPDANVPSPAPPIETPPEPSAAGVPLSITAEGGAVQWIKVETVLGQLVAEGDDTLDASIPSDTYTIALKMVGRPAVRGAVKLSAKGATLACAPDRDATVRCSGLKPPLVLKPE